MTYSRLTTALFGATALGLAFTYPAAAQQEVTEETACQALQELIDKAGEDVRQEFADAADIAEMNEGRACVVYMGRVEEAGGLTLDTAERDTDEPQTGQTEAESPERQAAGEQASDETTEVEVEVVSPDEETATEGTAAAESEQGAAEFKADVEQLEAEEQPTTAQAEAEGEFTADVEALEADEEAVATTQAQPTAEGQAAAGEQPETEERATGGQQATAEGQQETATSATAQQQPAEGEDSAEQQAATDEQDTTEQQAAAEDEQEAAGEQAAADEQQETEERAVGEQPEQRLVGTADDGQQPTAAQEAGQQAEAEAGLELPVSDIAGRDVVTQEGEEVGTIDRFVMIDGEAHAVFRRGGFFGFGGEDVAIPATNLAMSGEEVVLTGFDAEGFEALPEFQSDVETEIAAEETVRIGTVE